MTPRPDPERGSAPVEFVLTGSVLVALFLALIQLALVLHVRNTLIDAASSGAHYAALADRTDSDGVLRTRELIAARLTPAYAQNVSVTHESDEQNTMVVITVRTRFPLLGLWGVEQSMQVDGHAPLE